MSTFRSATTTLAPSLAKSRACAAPRPLAAPVTSATFPAILLLILCLLNSLSAQFRPASLRVLFSDAQQLGRPPDLDPSTITSGRSEEYTPELPSLMRISLAVLCLKKNEHSTHRTVLM